MSRNTSLMSVALRVLILISSTVLGVLESLVTSITPRLCVFESLLLDASVALDFSSACALKQRTAHKDKAR